MFLIVNFYQTYMLAKFGTEPQSNALGRSGVIFHVCTAAASYRCGTCQPLRIIIPAVEEYRNRDLFLPLSLQTGSDPVRISQVLGTLLFGNFPKTTVFTLLVSTECVKYIILQLSTSVGHYFRRCIRPEVRNFGVCACAFKCLYRRIAYGFTIPQLSWSGDVNPCMQTYLPLFAEARQYVDCGIEDCGIAAD
jgi:hypothetical protein